MFKWFKGIDNLEDLKKRYRELAMIHHPDRPNGNLENMQKINAEYDILFPILQAKTEKKAEKFEHIDEFKNIIDRIINLNINIEICGIYLWVTGETKAVKEILKDAGCMWAKKKLAWYWKPEGYQPQSRRDWKMSEIRETFGQQIIKNAEELKRI